MKIKSLTIVTDNTVYNLTNVTINGKMDMNTTLHTEDGFHKTLRQIHDTERLRKFRINQVTKVV